MTLAAECAAFSRTTFGKLVLLAPFGLFDGAPRQRLQARALEAAARLLGTLGDRGLAKRLHRVRSEMLLVCGERDAIVPASYAKRFASGISGGTQTRILAGAEHSVDFDARELLAAAIEEFLGD